ncbi:MAG: ZIP family metal transporter [Nanoarchaeota archaeon]|nr:ZIP family metal transporter [Nanoarchaeota archaeon]
MLNVFLWILASVIVVSLLSFVGVIALALNDNVLRKIIKYLVGFAAGGLLGGAFIHLIPEASESGFTLLVSGYLLLGMIFSFIVEKFIHWRHCHVPTSKSHPHPVAIMNLVGDAVHNFLDGLIIAGSYVASIPVGIATTVAVIAHEIPQEIGDFGVLIYGGFKKFKALIFNFLSALFAVLGAVIGFFLSSSIDHFKLFLLPFAAGGFIYIAGSDLIPEMHKELKAGKSALQLLFFIIGMLLMVALKLLFD